MEIFTEKLGDDFRKNCEMIDSLLRVDKSFDIIKREMKIAGANCVMYYIDGFVKAELMQKLMVYLISVKEIGDGSKDAAYTFAAKSVPTVEVDVTDSADNIILMVLSGCTAFLSEGFGPNAIIIDSRTYPTRSTEEPEGDRVMRGSRDGFVETLIFNTAMLRRRIRDTSFTVEYLNIGKRSRTDIAICYMDGIADAEYVSKLRANLESIDADSIILGHQSIAESLIRTRVSTFRIEDAKTLDEIETLKQEGKLAELLVPIDAMFPFYPKITVKDDWKAFAKNGNPLDLKMLKEACGQDEETQVRLYDESGKFIAIYQWKEKKYHIVKMFFNE